MYRPPNLHYVHVDDTGIRHDINSDDMRRVHPDLPKTCEGRLKHVRSCDERAYQTIRDQFPCFTPPGYGLGRVRDEGVRGTEEEEARCETSKSGGSIRPT